ncbi:hypothetical protein GSH16_03240 [Rhodobacteraceae bacterium KN286]|uniref:Glycosyl transferase family 2 n=1 Tax=Oceanomicrobium pacificus TaxID=2692916 RepID=A0A6B0TPA5_9RHOB|nr:hypothetical protein [Oceanomicrobium pacificus]
MSHLSASTTRTPLAVLLAEDRVELKSSLDHLARIGFTEILLLGAVQPEPDAPEGVSLLSVPHRLTRLEDSIALLNRVIPAVAGRWIHYCFNAEYLYFPFLETRSISDALTFVEEERRQSVFTCAIDLYADDLSVAPGGVDRARACFDKSGYYAQTRHADGVPLPQQVDVYGGLRWRFEEHIPWDRRRIDRISLFIAAPDLQLDTDFQLRTPEHDTVSCPWHHNMTMCVCSFRVAKALRHNPGSRAHVTNFRWSGSEPFRWSSMQLMEHGFMEPGQWF